MKNILILTLLMMPLLALAQQVDQKQLQGTWILSDMQSKDSIWVAVAPDAQVPATSSKQPVPQYEQKKISLVEYMMKDLTCGSTRFEFSGDTFKFFRQTELTFSGTYKLKGQKLILEYDNGAGKSTKENTVVSISGDKLVLASESKEKPVLMSFVKK